jgi:hypothetical protein
MLQIPQSTWTVVKREQEKGEVSSGKLVMGLLMENT